MRVYSSSIQGQSLMMRKSLFRSKEFTVSRVRYIAISVQNIAHFVIGVVKSMTITVLCLGNVLGKGICCYFTCS